VDALQLWTQMKKKEQKEDRLTYACVQGNERADRDRQRERETERESGRERERHRETERDRERQRETERDRVC
jgi:hypothetical protein